MMLSESSIIQLFEDPIVSFTGICSAPSKVGYVHGPIEGLISMSCLGQTVLGMARITQ